VGKQIRELDLQIKDDSPGLMTDLTCRTSGSAEMKGPDWQTARNDEEVSESQLMHDKMGHTEWMCLAS
jgi:hypothetical protein